jgi:hypothetical protein
MAQTADDGGDGVADESASRIVVERRRPEQIHARLREPERRRGSLEVRPLAQDVEGEAALPVGREPRRPKRGSKRQTKRPRKSGRRTIDFGSSSATVAAYAQERRDEPFVGAVGDAHADDAFGGPQVEARR